MQSFSQTILSSISGTMSGVVIFGLIFSFIVYALKLVDKSSEWIGVIQNPVLLALIFGVILGGIFGFLVGLIIGIFKIFELLKGALVSFAVAEFIIIIFLVAASFLDFKHLINFNRLSESITNSFFSFLFLSLFLLIPSVIVGIGTVKMNDLIRAMLNL